MSDLTYWNEAQIVCIVLEILIWAMLMLINRREAATGFLAGYLLVWVALHAGYKAML